jgi:ABC-2 type transport system ATP-binding protein
VHDPDLLILDEPTNGLDPAGRADFLELLREVNETGIALLLSTHLLPDVQEVCKDVVVIGKGRALRAGSVADLTKDLEGARIVRVMGDAAPLLAELACRGVAATADEGTGDLRVILADGQDNRVIFAAAAVSGTGLRGLVPASRTLETVFLESLEAPRADS